MVLDALEEVLRLDVSLDRRNRDGAERLELSGLEAAGAERTARVTRTAHRRLLELEDAEAERKAAADRELAAKLAADAQAKAAESEKAEAPAKRTTTRRRRRKS